jgi:hypothetical protein
VTIAGGPTRVQVEAGAFSSPWIDTAGTTVTRAATNLSIPSAGFIRANDWGLMGLVIPGASGQGTVLWAISTYTDGDNSTGVFFSNTSFLTYKRVSGVTHFASGTYAHTINTPFLYQAYQSSVYGMGIRVRQYSGGVWGAWSAWSTKNDADGRLDAPIAATVQIGARNNAERFAGNYPYALTIFADDPKTELEELV